MSKFEEYFRRADLDKDGRISGAEAVAFFQASNLPKPTLAQFNPAAQPNPMAPRPPTQQPGIGLPNSMAPPSALYFSPQGNQSMRPPPQSGFLPSQGVGGPSFLAVGGLAGPGLSNSYVSGDWLGGRAPDSSQDRPTWCIECFYKATHIVQSAGPSLPRPNQQAPSQNTKRIQVPNTPLPQWPKMTRAGVSKYMKVFMEVDSDRDGKIPGDQACSLFLSWRLPREESDYAYKSDVFEVVVLVLRVPVTCRSKLKLLKLVKEKISGTQWEAIFRSETRGYTVLEIIQDEVFDRFHDEDAVSLCCLGILQLVLLGAESKRRIPDSMLRLANDRVG
ncbi:epidermal growth factor receptor substrate 15-like protein 1 [Tanacetum coccineum]|uniref:Epidermal growth factor receptor substrate 15-like protein 1 n=1 Tax=Tanacetum coccineum TaxID=301880 RepID=A0ABQ5CSP1_9ASTR